MISEINAKSILRKYKKIDSWFIAKYAMNLYRGCQHNCAYCAGRAEQHHVEGDFGSNITVKINALEILRKELNPKRKKLEKSFLFLGGGVNDAYQPAEEQYQLTRHVLELALEFKWPVHIPTKSAMVERDLDLIQQINSQSKALISFSLSTVDVDVAVLFEPGASLPAERLRVLENFRAHGINGGIFYMPILPYVTDSEKQMTDVVRLSFEHKAQYLVMAGLTLKPGRQRQYYENVLKRYKSQHLKEYGKIYGNGKWGNVSEGYYSWLEKRFYNIARKWELAKRIPINLYNDILSREDLLRIALEHLDYLHRKLEKPSPFANIVSKIQNLPGPFENYLSGLKNISGIGPFSEKIILELWHTGTSQYYHDIMKQL